MLGNDGKKDKFTDQFGRSNRELSDYFGIGVQIAASFVFFFLLGLWADTRFGTSPLLMLAGVLVGMVGMGLVLMKTVQKANREHDDRSGGK